MTGGARAALGIAIGAAAAVVVACSTFSSTDATVANDAGTGADVAADADAGAPPCTKVDGFTEDFSGPLSSVYTVFDTDAGAVAVENDMLHAHVGLATAMSNEQAQIARAFKATASTAELRFKVTTTPISSAYVYVGCTLKIAGVDFAVYQVGGSLAVGVAVDGGNEPTATVDFTSKVTVDVVLRAEGLEGSSAVLSAQLNEKAITKLPPLPLAVPGMQDFTIVCGIDDANGGPADIDVYVDAVSFTLCD